MREASEALAWPVGSSSTLLFLLLILLCGAGRKTRMFLSRESVPPTVCNTSYSSSSQWGTSWSTWQLRVSAVEQQKRGSRQVRKTCWSKTPSGKGVASRGWCLNSEQVSLSLAKIITVILKIYIIFYTCVCVQMCACICLFLHSCLLHPASMPGLWFWPSFFIFRRIMRITSITSNNVMPNHFLKIHKMPNDLGSRWYSLTYKIIPVSFLFQK